MSDAQPASDRLESNASHLIQVSDPAVRYCPHAPEGLVNVAVYLAPERAESPRLIQILHDNNLGPGH